MRALVTGGAGFIGSHICEALLQQGVDVMCLDDLSAGSIDNIRHLDMHFAICDITEYERLDEIIRYYMPDVIFHNAASKKAVSIGNPARDLEVNTGGTLNLLRLALEYKVKKFIHASTGSVYGEPVEFPTTENCPCVPVSYYGISKLAAEYYVKLYHKEYGLDTTILRYHHVYGPRQENADGVGGVVAIFVRRVLAKQPLIIHGDGKQQRSFTWVGDVVNANLASLDAEAGQVYNVASGVKISVNRLADIVESVAGVVGVYGRVHTAELLGDIRYFDVSNDKICEHLDITFDVDIEARLVEMVNA